MCLYMYTCIHVDVQHFGANHMFQYMCLVCLLSLWVVCHSVAINYVTRCAFHYSYHYTGLDKSQPHVSYFKGNGNDIHVFILLENE